MHKSEQHGFEFVQRSLKINLTIEKFLRHCYNLNFDEVDKYYNKLMQLYAEYIDMCTFGENLPDFLVIERHDNNVDRLDPKKEHSLKQGIDTIQDNHETFKAIFDDTMTYKKDSNTRRY